jgi:hydrogenase/urease accessory protein HupE
MTPAKAKGNPLLAGVGEDAGRNAYLAGFHAAQAVIHARSGRTAKTHNFRISSARR